MSDEAPSEGVGVRERVRTAATWTGGVLSLSLFVGIALWGWQVFQRDANGVPLIRSAEGAMRVAPDEPGGARAEHQGLSVSRIAAGAVDTPPSAVVRLAPRVPALAAEDFPADPEPAPQMQSTDLAVAEALGLDLAQMVAAVPPKRPAPRPVVRASPAPDPAPAAVGELVQLGAFDDQEIALREWQRLSGRFPDLLEGTVRRVEAVERAGRTIWRLRAGGFEDMADARRTCAALMAGDAECVPVVRQ